MPVTSYPQGLQGSPMIGSNLVDIFQGAQASNVLNPLGGNVFFADGDLGSDSFDGTSPDTAKKTIQAAVTAAAANGVIYIKARKVAAGGTDPVNYAETIIIPATKFGLKLIGVGSGIGQGGQPQIKIGAGSTAMITVRAPGCLIFGLTINCGSSTGAGILLDDDGSTKSAFGTVIENCYFKNNANKTQAAGGGAIAWSSNGGGWTTRITRCKFYDCTTGINILGTGAARPKDVVIENCEFASSAASGIDGDIDMSAGSGVDGIFIRNCAFQTVDVPSKAGGNCGYYLNLTNCTNGSLTNCTFGCTGSTIGAAVAAGQAGKVPTTVRMAHLYQENAIFTRT